MGLRILIYCDDHGTGGAAQATHRLALGLAGRGYEVAYAQTPADNPWVAERQARGITRVDLPYDTIRHFTAAMDEVRVPTRLFSEHRPDLAIFADSLMESTLGAKQAAAFLRIPYLIVKHLVVADALYTRQPALKQRVHEVFTGSAGLITVSEQNRALLLEQFPEEGERFAVIPNSVPDAFFAPSSGDREEVRESWRRELAIPDGALAVLTVAAVNQRKGFHYQAHMIKGLKTLGMLSRFVFVWAGEPDAEFFNPLRKELEEAGCTEAIRVLGFRSDVARCLEGCDAFLLPSQQEGMPLVVLEAMAKGVPAIASAVGGTPEALGDAGVLVHSPNSDPNRMIQQILQTLDLWQREPDVRRRVGDAGRRRAETVFRAGAMIDRYEAMVRRAVFPAGDYVAPGLALVKPDWTLPFLKPDGSGPHVRYKDSRFPRLPGYALDRDEAHILHNTARGLAGGCALEVGCSMGWTSGHLMAAGMRVDIVDPLLSYSEIRQAIVDGLPPGGTRSVRLVIGRAADMVASIVEVTRTPWDLVFVDSQREMPKAEPDRIPWERYTAPDAAVFVHGLDLPEAAEPLRRLKGLGWSTRVYRTSRLMGVAWRGRATPAAHIPDPALPAQLPDHLADLA